MRPTALLAIAFLTLTLSVACSSHAGSSAAQSELGAQRILPAVKPGGGSASQYLSHVVVIVQENRSFENFFAGYPNANAPMTGCASPPPGLDVRHHGSSSSCPPGDTQVTLHQDTFETNPDLRHDWLSSMVDWNNGQMDGFSQWGIKNGPDRAYDYIEHSQIKPYLTIANQYVLADEMF
ncbi:MAG: alkaline phosphatase family protein, partial [Candidatus Cybelea sp.]